MQVGLLTTSFPRFAGDSAGQFVLGSARSLVNRGHAVEVLAPEPAAPHSAHGHGPGIRVSLVPYARPRKLQQTFYGAGAPENIASAPWRAAGVASLGLQLLRVARTKPHWDAILSHWAFPCGLVGAAVAGRRPHLAICHSADVFALTRLPAGHHLRRWLARQGTRFWFVSTIHERAFLDDLPYPLRDVPRHVSPMGVDGECRADTAQRAAARAVLGMRGFNALALGRLIPIKGLEDAVRGIHAFNARSPALPATLWLAGEGPSATRLAHLAKGLGVHLRLLGHVSGPLKTNLLAGADALLVPSRAQSSGRAEGFPTAITEAQLAGLPVIATRTGGMASVLHDGVDALLVPPSAPVAIADALARVTSDSTLRRRLTDAGRRAAEPRCWDRLAPVLEQLLS